MLEFFLVDVNGDVCAHEMFQASFKENQADIRVLYRSSQNDKVSTFILWILVTRGGLCWNLEGAWLNFRLVIFSPE